LPPRRVKAAPSPSTLGVKPLALALKAARDVTRKAGGDSDLVEFAIAAAFGRLKADIAKGLPELERDYRQTGNPYFPLEALELARRAHVPIPPWVKAWQDNVFRALSEADSRDLKQLAKAIGFGTGRGRRSAAAQYDQIRADQIIAQQVRAEMNKPGGDKQQAAINTVAQRHGKSFSAIHKAVHRANRPFPSPRRR
jgi:hypothetical protein